MSNNQLNQFLAIKSYDTLHTDQVQGGTCKRKIKRKNKNGELEVKVKVKGCE